MHVYGVLVLLVYLSAYARCDNMAVARISVASVCKIVFFWNVTSTTLMFYYHYFKLGASLSHDTHLELIEYLGKESNACYFALQS